MEYASATISGIARADAGANENWKIAAYETVTEIAKKQETFTADDVMRVLEKNPIKTKNLRAFGPVMIRIAKNGIAEKTNEVVSSERENQHNCPIRVWKSKVYSGPKVLAAA